MSLEKLSLLPSYINHRIEIFDRLKSEYDAKVAAFERKEIKISLPDGKVVSGTSWETTPMAVCKSLSNSLAERIVIAKVNGNLFDMNRPLEEDCTLHLLDFESDQGRRVFWHSSAHVLGEACEKSFSCHLCLGPPLEEGFYYEMGMDRPVVEADYKQLTESATAAIKEKQPFVRLEMSKENLLEMFKDNKYKVALISKKIPDGTSSTVYRCGPLIDLCLGPHIPHTGKIKAFKVLKNSSSYFLADANNDTLQRVYGISFPDNKQMKEFITLKEEAEKRDHRRVGKEQQLFFFHDLSPGSCFFLPHGTRVYNKLVEFIREQYVVRGFNEVITPNIFNVNLWKTSGHYQNYASNMFSFKIEGEEFALKPMNCPGHCLMFSSRDRSYRELPLRYADFGVLHRNELSGALTGLTRVRRFQQDDAHIFCRRDQISSEIKSCLQFMDFVYGIFGFTYALKLSTRPEKYLGDVETWDSAEKQLEETLTEFGHPWEINEGDGAFYGPKIDITISDANKKRHQCATIQLDFQLPERFNLKFKSGEDEDIQQPVIIHRAILGSVERLMAILVENFGHSWPFWLAPRQIMVVPIDNAFKEYASKVNQRFVDAGFYSDLDLSDFTFNKKIRNSEVAQYCHIVVVGAKEQDEGCVNVRKARDGKDVYIPLEAAVEQFKKLNLSKTRDNRFQ